MNLYSKKLFCFLNIIFFVSALTSYSENNKIDTSDADSVFKTADSLSSLLLYNKSIEFYLKAQSIYETTGAWKKFVISGNKAGWRLSMYLHNMEKAKETLNYTLTHGIKGLDSSHVELANTYNNIASLHRIMGNFDEAIKNHLLSLKIRIYNFGPESPFVAITYNNLGLTYIDIGDYGKALDYLNQTVHIRSSNLEKDDLLLASSYNNLGIAFFHLKDYENANLFYTKALNIYLSKLVQKHEEIGNIYLNIGLVYKEMYNPEKALENLDQAIKQWFFVLDSSHFSISISYLNFGNVYTDLKNYALAMSYYQKSIKNLTLNFGKYHPQLGNVHKNLANVYLINHDFDNAIIELEQSFDCFNANFISTSIKNGFELNNIVFSESKINSEFLFLESLRLYGIVMEKKWDFEKD